MKRFKRVLVNLNLDESDENLMNYASTIARMAKSEQIFFMYAEEGMVLPEPLFTDYPQLNESLGDLIRDRIKKEVERYFKEKEGKDFNYIVLEGNSLDEILKQSRLNSIDLIINGVSKNQHQSKSMSIKLARKSPCSVLTIPENVACNLGEIAVAVDFSDNSKEAMDTALAFARADKKSKLKILHVYTVPTGYYATGKSYEEFAEIMKGHAVKHMADFLKDFNLSGINVTELYLLDNDPAETIMDKMQEYGCSFLIVGARGLGAAAAVLLGSVTENLIQKLNVPIFAVKKKGDHTSFLDALS